MAAVFFPENIISTAPREYCRNFRRHVDQARRPGTALSAKVIVEVGADVRGRQNNKRALWHRRRAPAEIGGLTLSSIAAKRQP